ncbi:putative transposase, mutator type, MULE transposase domain protein [Tanacetum coccineum]|uniref:Transposase, mutator type, MULE transposase domain protein n=1 Tax=Tanacetum coccineum TaxID=301880 RepID=A0ABQ5DYE7_9ASTR
MYVNDHVDIFDMVDIDLFIVVALNMMVVKLGYTCESEPLLHNYLRPVTILDEGLYVLACEEDVRCLATLVRNFKLIEVYIEHGVTTLNTYIRAPRFRATIKEVTNEPGNIAPIEHRSEKMLFLTWHDSSEPTKEPVCESVRPRCLPHYMLTSPSDESVITYTQLSFDDVAWSGVKSYGLSHDESFGVDDLDLNLNEPVDLNVSQIETQSELPVSEELDVVRSRELIVAEVRTQEPVMEEVRTRELIMEDVIVEYYVTSGEDVEHGNCHEDESTPSDGQFFYDDEGIDIAYETKYDVYMDLLFKNIGVTNLVPDNVLEGEDVNVINADGFNSDPGNDDETSNYKRRRLAELSREIKGVINVSGQWKYSFYTGQKFTTAKEAKDRLYMHSIESRRNLKLYKNDSVRIRARCDGKVYVFIMSQGTGPTGLNRGMEVGPSGSSGPSTRSKKRKNSVRVNPDIPVKAVQDQLQRDLKATNPNIIVKIAVERNIDPSLPTMCLGDDIDLHPNLNFTFISDRQKVFNGKIVGGRDKLVITLLEYIGEYCMKRICVVDVVTRTCSCKEWELTGIPCKHAIAACWNMVAPPPEAWVGRPKKKRKRSKHEDEPFVKDGKLSKKGRTITCQSCINIGHNKATCKGQGGNNVEASGSASRKAQQAEPAVGQDGLGGSRVGAVIGLSVADGAGDAGRAVGAVSETKNADGREMGDGIPTQSSATGGATLGWLLEEIHVTWAHLEKKRTRLQLYIQGEDDYFLQIMQTASEIMATPSRLQRDDIRIVCDGVRT